ARIVSCVNSPCCWPVTPAEIATYTLSLHDALPILRAGEPRSLDVAHHDGGVPTRGQLVAVRIRRLHGTGELARHDPRSGRAAGRSEEHTSELQSRENLVCRLLLEKENPYEYTRRVR